MDASCHRLEAFDISQATSGDTSQLTSQAIHIPTTKLPNVLIVWQCKTVSNDQQHVKGIHLQICSKKALSKRAYVAQDNVLSKQLSFVCCFACAFNCV